MSPRGVLTVDHESNVRGLGQLSQVPSIPLMPRSPRQTLVLAAAIGCGVVLGALAVGRHAAGNAPAHERAAWPDLDFQHAAPADLVGLGFRLTGREPTSWSDISNRQYQDARGFVNVLSCRIAPAEAEALVRFPASSWCPSDGLPPADWPRGPATEPLHVPAWWTPATGQSRCYAAPTPDGGRGIFASYEPSTQLLTAWIFTRSDWRPTPPADGGRAGADELVTTLEQTLRAAGHPLDGAGWLVAIGIEPARSGLVPARLPPGLTRIDAALLPVKGGHRYLLVLSGLDEAAARTAAVHPPLRPLPDDGPPPFERWRFASQPGPHLPTWFAPGPGWRGHHCLIRLGSGEVEAGRWVAYDRAARALYLWDWEGPGVQPPVADLNAP